MILHNAYLTDEELKQLISEAEDDLVPAPPELTRCILTSIESSAFDAVLQNVEQSDKNDKRQKQLVKKNVEKEFVGYCFRVVASAAAAIAFVFIVPYLPCFSVSGMEDGLYEETKPWEVELTEELQIAEFEKLRDYPTREEVLNDANFFERVFGENGIFIKNNGSSILKEENGGQ